MLNFLQVGDDIKLPQIKTGVVTVPILFIHIVGDKKSRFAAKMQRVLWECR